MKEKILEYLKVAFLLLVLLSLTFLVYKFCYKPSEKTYTVIHIIDADKFYVDFNKNNKPDIDELIKLSAVNSLKPSFANYLNEQLEYIGIDKASGVLVGNLANQYTEQNLLYKNVKVKFVKEGLDDELYGYRFAKVYLNDKDWAEILLEKGFATVYRKSINAKKYLKYENTYQIKENAKQELAKNYVIVNLKTEIYHKLTCKYGQMIKRLILIPQKDLPSFYKKCHFCYNEEFKENLKQEKQIFANFDKTSGAISIYFTDFTKNLKPSDNLVDENSRALIKLIGAAKKTIDIAAYGLDNNTKIVKALKRAQDRGIKIRIVADKNSKGETTYQTQLVEKELGKIVYDDKIPNNKDNDISAKITAKYKNQLMHNKFAVFDNAIVYTGSLNIAKNDLSGFNSNVSVVIRSGEIANIFTKEFEQMYEGIFHQLKSKTTNNENIVIDNYNTVSVYFSPQDNITDSKIIPLINKAQSYIYVPIFSFTDKNLMSAIEAAKNRGVDVKVIADATNCYGDKFEVNRFRKKGIPTKVENYAGKMHMKSIIIDDKYLIIGSMNFSKAGQYSNDENVVIIRNHDLAQSYKNQFLYTYSKIDNRWLKYSPSAESWYSIGSCEDKVDNNFDGAIDSADKRCQKIK